MSRQPLISIDFDGVLHSYESGWQGADTIPDPPVDGAIEWLETLVSSDEVHVSIYSSRSSQKGGIKAMQDWLVRHGFEPPISSIDWPESKPPATVSVDDRAIRFEGQGFPSLKALKSFTPWWDDDADNYHAVVLLRTPNRCHLEMVESFQTEVERNGWVKGVNQGLEIGSQDSVRAYPLEDIRSNLPDDTQRRVERKLS
ncbi:MAG: hypothetical protein ABEN55_04075 [Bradymonadaceae bacterium]